ncbi:hypothetical protein ALC60_13070 [Trachymyrmex zeteki]|uniref:Uncharacterized protein n=1 Tax=Mycetomoellerius zeteki TaxID=64791 RepID=A0A151WJB8_9HYME|nr:hypothetical protein ALC60_13070 [Trachymyrmex zeteki]
MKKKKNESSTVIVAGQYPRGHDNPSGVLYWLRFYTRAVEIDIILFLIRYQRLKLSHASLSNRASSMMRLEFRHRKTALRKSEQHHKARGQALMAHYFRSRRQDGIIVNHLGLPVHIDLKIILMDDQNNYIQRLSVDDYNYFDGTNKIIFSICYSTRNIEVMDFRYMEKWPLCQIACKMPELRLERPRKSGSNGETDPHRWYIFSPEVATTISRE